MTMSKEPDYVRYSLEQLERARRSIDVERFPERTKILDILIADRKHRQQEADAAAQSSSSPANTSEGSDYRKNYFEFKTPAQALLSMLGSLVFGVVGIAIMLMEGMTGDINLLFVTVWGLISLLNATHCMIEFQRLRKQVSPSIPVRDEPKAVAQPSARPVNLAESNKKNQSPVERL